MTKALTKAEKKEKRDGRKSNQQKAASPTVKTVNQPKPEDQKPPAEAALVNLCDDCAYEFGACDGIPKFAAEGDDRVVECQGFRNVQNMPTAAELEKNQAAAPGPAAAEEPAQDEPELVAAEPIEGATEEEKAADAAIMAADLEERRKKVQRFQREEDLGNCSSCQRPLKRTAYNRDRDAVRCTNPRCRQYRAVVKTLKAE